MKKLICQSHLKSKVEIETELRPLNCKMTASSLSLADLHIPFSSAQVISQLFSMKT